MVGKLRSLNCELYETADEIGRLRFVKSNLEGDVNELTKGWMTMMRCFWKGVGKQDN